MLAQTKRTNTPTPNLKINSPLAVYSSEWNQPRYNVCNTAQKIKYMSVKEKKLSIF
jgi:hypothetical protein